MRNERNKQSPERGVWLRVAILTISDRCSKGETEDVSGKVIKEIIRDIGGEAVSCDIVPDEINLIEEKLLIYCDDLKVDLVLTTGGTGLGPRDVTPEATRKISDKVISGISELMQIEGLKKTRNAVLSRGISVIRGNSIIINLPGSPQGAGESLRAIWDIIPHALDMLNGKGHLVNS